MKGAATGSELDNERERGDVGSERQRGGRRGRERSESKREVSFRPKKEKLKIDRQDEQISYKSHGKKSLASLGRI